MEIRSYHGASPDGGTNVAGGTLQFKQADNDTVDANNPIPIPAAGTNYSYVKNIRFYANVTPPNTFNNLRFYMDGANGLGTGVGLRVRTQAGYEDPIALAAAQLTGTTDAFAATSGAPLAVTGSINNPSTGAFGNYVQLQMTVASTAAAGNTPTETATWAWDES